MSSAIAPPSVRGEPVEPCATPTPAAIFKPFELMKYERWGDGRILGIPK
jgi:hypothetical protein